MSPIIILIIISIYFIGLIGISFFTKGKADSADYYIGSKKSIWWIVALGMVSDSLSGVTFISVPGGVLNDKMYYMQVVFGYVVGNFIIAYWLLPLYYKTNLTSIYSYLGTRFGIITQKTGSSFFLLSRILGAAARLFLASNVLQVFVFAPLGVPYFLTVLIIIVLILTYTIGGGIKTLVWTDALQSIFLLGSLFLSLYWVFSNVNFDQSTWEYIKSKDLNTIFNWDIMPKSNFFKMFIGGIFIAITMTGMDQNMMQKNLSCKNLKEAQKNILSFNSSLIFINFFFLSLGVLMYVYAFQNGIQLPHVNEKILTDEVFPFLAFNHWGQWAGIIFILGLTAATFSSADSVLTTLTTSFCIDFLNYDINNESTKNKRIRQLMHSVFALLLFIAIICFYYYNNATIITTVLLVAGYTYGPILGFFVFGLMTNIQIKDKWIWVIALISPILTFYICNKVPKMSNGFEIGNLNLILNGLLTFVGMYLISNRKSIQN